MAASPSAPAPTRQAVAQAVAVAQAEQRLRFLALIRATCACGPCKDAVAAELLKEGE